LTNIQRILSLASILVLTAASQSAKPHNYKPPQGYVPTEVVAVRVAEAILVPIYGEDQIKGERPLSAKLEGDRWHVEGYLPPDMKGGVAEVWISKQTGEIFRVTHGK
jgi:hypothetical protein